MGTVISSPPDLNGAQPLSVNELNLIHAYWRAANYLSVGQIYLLDNPLLRRPLKLDDIKPRLLGHWGTTPGLNLIYAHTNRVLNTGIWMPSTSWAQDMAGRPVLRTRISKGRTGSDIRT